MMTRNFSKWLLSSQGKTFTYMAGGAMSTVIMLAHALPQTLLLDHYKEFLSFYKNGMSVPLSKGLQERFQKTLDNLKVKPIDQPRYKPFHVYGFDVVSAGISESIFGAIIGIPVNFEYSSVDTASDKPTVVIGQKELDWNSESGRKLLYSLVLSENAQIYAMGHEIKMRQTFKPMLDIIYGTSSAMLTYGVSRYINIKSDLYSKPRTVRLIMYSLIATFFCTTYFMLKDLTNIYLEKRVDEELKKTDSIFMEGGKEFYTKLIDRNKILREILGKKGEKMYTALGNDNSYIRTKHLPLVQRKSFFEEKLPETA